jgi:hypothetical protein
MAGSAIRRPGSEAGVETATPAIACIDPLVVRNRTIDDRSASRSVLLPIEVDRMTNSLDEDRRLIRLTEIALALPEAARECHGQHASFTVRKKKFAYYLDDHHGDGIVAFCFRTEPGENEALLASDPSRFYGPAYIGPRGWIGLRLDVGEIDWEEVADFVTDSYCLAAPKRLAACVTRPSG